MRASRPLRRARLRAVLAAALVPPALLAGCATARSGTAAPAPVASAAPTPSASASQSGLGEPGALAADVYGHARAGMLTGTTRAAAALVYVPNTMSNTVDVIDPGTYKVVRSFPVPALPQHVVPSWDMKVLWVNDNS